MRPFTVLDGIAAPLPLANVDTDVIIRVERCATLRRGQFGPYAFESLRAGGFVLDRPPFDRAAILVAKDNFGCGSSREPAVWALQDAGIRCVVAPSFGGIFFDNCFANGVLPVCLPGAAVDTLLARLERAPALTVDLVAQEIRALGMEPISFEVEPLRRTMLMEGQDQVGLTLRLADRIGAFQAVDTARRPWLAEGLRSRRGDA